MFAKVVVVLFASCAVVLARPQDANALQQAQYQYWLQLLNANQPQYANSNQVLTPNQLLSWNQLQGLYNPSALYPNQQQLLLGLSNGFGNGNRLQSPIMEVPNHAIDFGQKLIEDSLSRVGAALSDAYGKTEQVANNVVDTVNELGRRGFQDGATLAKGGIGLLGVIPRLGFGLLTRNNQQQPQQLLQLQQLLQAQQLLQLQQLGQPQQLQPQPQQSLQTQQLLQPQQLSQPQQEKSI